MGLNLRNLSLLKIILKSRLFSMGKKIQDLKRMLKYLPTDQERV